MSVITSFDEVLGETPRNGQFVVIGPAGAGPDVAEIALVASVDENGWTLYRGVLDTVPSTWPAGTTIWCVPGAEAIPDDTVRAFGEFVTYKLLPTTSLGTLDEDDAPEVVAQASRRPHRVLRPANVKINGTGFGIVDASNVSSLTITWARRNRSYEATQALQWTDGDVAPEAGQETVIRVMDSSGVIILEIGAPGTSYTLNTSSFGGRTSGQIQVLSRRSGFDSMQAYTLHVANIGATANYLRLSGDTAGDPTDSLLLSGDAQSSGIDKLRIT